MDKILETNFRFYVKQRTMGKFQDQVLRNFLLVLTKFSFREKNWAPNYNFMHSMQICFKFSHSLKS